MDCLICGVTPTQNLRNIEKKNYYNDRKMYNDRKKYNAELSVEMSVLRYPEPEKVVERIPVSNVLIFMRLPFCGPKATITGTIVFKFSQTLYLGQHRCKLRYF